MSACLNLQWLPDSLADEARRTLSQLLARWAADWGAPQASHVVARLLSAGIEPLDGLSPCSAWPDDWHNTLAHALIGPAGPASEVGRSAAREAAEDLQAALRQRFCAAPGERPWPVAPLGHAGVELSFEWLGQSFVIPLDAEELRAGGWLRRQRTKPLAKVALEHALADLPVRLTAQLGSAAVSATEVLQLQAGDVLLLEQTLDTPLRVVCAGSALQLTAHLGTVPSTLGSIQRAVRWLAH